MVNVMVSTILSLARSKIASPPKCFEWNEDIDPLILVNDDGGVDWFVVVLDWYETNDVLVSICSLIWSIHFLHDSGLADSLGDICTHCSEHNLSFELYLSIIRVAWYIRDMYCGVDS